MSDSNGKRPAQHLSAEEVNRYSRHLTLPEVGVAGQEKIKAARVLCIGSGGLGSPIGLYLAAAGVGTIGVVDFDVVDVSNLQRQIAHTTPDVGLPKVDSIRAKMQAMNPNVRVEPHPVKLTRDNALELFSQYDLIVDGSDNFETRYLVNDAAFFARKPLVYGSIFRFEGQVSVFNPHAGGACYRCLFASPPPA
ncbi:MAG TPA: ThiF family adenylyltransferase, partial [bacterium]|nr:ThiF family adenylyltransferase [bacterium]